MSPTEIDTTQTVNLTNCDRESIHIPGSIQPHGLIFSLTEPELEITELSKNIYEFLRIYPEELLHKNLADLLGPEQTKNIKNALFGDFSHINPLKLSPIAPIQKNFNGIIHRWGGNLILELEPVEEEKTSNFFEFYQLTRHTISRIKNASNLSALCSTIVSEMRRLTGFDRVMVYQFDEEGSGSVIAEDKREDLNSFLGLHYPATDIPKPARQLYTLNLLRLIPDVNYKPVELIKSPDASQKPLDLSLAGLRSVSPVHIEYLNNMGVAASMSISLLHDRKFWGLIACHHYSPKYVSYELRTACEFLGQIVGLELASKEKNEGLNYKMQLKSLQSKFVESISHADNFVDALVKDRAALLKLVGAQGAAVCADGHLTVVGKTPPEEEIEALLTWLEPQIKSDIFYTNTLAKLYPPAESFKNVASGLLALAIAKIQKHYILWFRGEVIQTVNWAGDPQKSAQVEEDGSLTLTPRKSFERWQETVRSQSLPWQPCEVDGALELKSAIVGIVLRKADELAQINLELQRSNTELDAFAYIASHDLKEPLRGIHNYSSFLLEDYAGVLDREGVSKLETLVRLTQRMEDLINALLHFSRLGREELKMQPTDLNKVVENVAEVVSISNPKTQVNLCIPRPLPTIQCDRILVEEVFANLIGNSLKYNEQTQKEVEIGWMPANQYQSNKTGTFPVSTMAENFNDCTQENPFVFYVRDNGIGIRDRHLNKIFLLFKRLYGPTKYGEGTGAGLTIVKKIVERHGGKIWVESVYGQGTTFYFTLAE